jgi:ribosomal protein L16 Arg81 hydroxylase
MQLAGESVWQVCLPPAASNEDAVWLARLNRTAATASESKLNCTSYSLAAGDSLYIPPGVQHTSEPGPASVLWAKVVLPSPGPTWVEVLQKACNQLSSAQSGFQRDCARRIAQLSKTIDATDKEARLLHEAAGEGRFRLQSPLALARRVQDMQVGELKAALRAQGESQSHTSPIPDTEGDLFTALGRLLDEARETKKVRRRICPVW